MTRVAPRRVLVICTANQCRSPMAEGLIRARAAPELRLEVASAGTWAEPDRPATDLAIAVMTERGIDISSSRSAEITVAEVVAADLVLVMTAGPREALHTEFPEARHKTIRISELAGGSWDVADPVGGTLEDYRATAAELERLIDAGWARIAYGDETAVVTHKAAQAE